MSGFSEELWESKEKKSEVSVVIAVRNGENTIHQTIRSILGQTVKVKKIIVVDDCSTDRTIEAVGRFADSSGLIEMIPLPKNVWLYNARNIGAEKVETPFFFFLDADDMIEESYVDAMLLALSENEDKAFAYCQHKHFGGGETKVFDVPEYDIGHLLQNNYIAYSSMLRTDAFRRVGGYSEFLNDCRSHMTEWDLWLRMHQSGLEGIRVGLPLFLYRQNENQMSRETERPRSDMFFQMLSRLDDSVALGESENNKILVVCQGKDYLDKTQVGFEVWQWVRSLEEFGEVFTFFYDVEIMYRGQMIMRQDLTEYIEKIKPDYIFHPAYKNDIPVEDWERISKGKAETIVWFSDDDRRLNDYSLDYARGFKTIMTTYPDAFEKYDKQLPGRWQRVILTQWAVNQKLFGSKRSEDEKAVIDVSFFGQPYGDRQMLVMAATGEVNARPGSDGFCLCGKGWKNIFPQMREDFVSYPEMIKLMSRSLISLNFSKGIDGNRQLKLRPFEICASGALCLTEWSPGLHNYFKFTADKSFEQLVEDPDSCFSADDEVVVFNDRDDLILKLRYLLKNSSLRKCIADNGRRRVFKEHTWAKRFENVIRKK